MQQPRTRRYQVGVLALLLAGAVWIGLASDGAVAAKPVDWLQGWSLPPEFVLEVEQDGLSFPTALAFVPHPGAEPLDPLYFVTELGGTTRVVSNNRTVTTFATQPIDPSLYHFSSGLAGLCLDAAHGYVFTTLARRDEGGLLRNQIVRYTTPPGTFGRAPSETLLIASPFARDQAAEAHQIGNCQVDGEALYVGVGDGWDPAAGHRLDGLRGKLLRLTLDGQPYPGNPLSSLAGPRQEAAPYVWALGLRNPFALKLLGGQLFVADNGANIDRLIKVKPGQDYGWNDTDWSIGIGAQAVFEPAIGPAQMDRYPTGQALFPAAYRQRFYLAAAGTRNASGVVSLPYDLSADHAEAAPSFFLRSQGASTTRVTGLAFGPDGLYISAFTGDPEAPGAVLRIVARPEAGDAPPPSSPTSAMERFAASGCLACHQFNGVGATDAPTLNQYSDGVVRARLLEWLNSTPYNARLDQLDTLDQEPFRSLRGARAAVRASVAMNKLRVWIQQHVRDPRFDDPDAAPPSVTLPVDEAVGLSDLLIPADPTPPTLRERLAQWILELLAPLDNRPRAGLAGLAAGTLGTGLLTLLVQRWRRGRDRR
jgi:glucose/sorbosone dehydrogenase